MTLGGTEKERKVGLTNFPNGIFATPNLGGGSGMLSPMGANAKAFFVDVVNGSDGNTGRSMGQALATVGKAESLCTDKAGDVVYLMNDGNTTGTSREATIPLVWDKDNTHLVGLCAPSVVSQRARITPVATAALLEAPVIDVTGSGCVFANLQIAHFAANTDTIGCQGVSVSGHRNYFYNVHIVGVPNDHSGDETDSVDLLIDGGAENVFVHCAIGVDTVVRSTTNACLELTTAATRNLFEDCVFAMTTDNAGPLFVKADGSGDLDRWTIFRGCSFINAVESGATSLTSAVNVHNTAGGLLMFQNCQIVGADNVAAADNGNVWVDGVGGAGTGGLSIVATQ